jgi:cytochrome d ubiquinol oxidase subunit II
MDYETLKLIWWLLIGILLIGFAIADGMDMGVGTLLTYLGKTDTERRVMINAVAPHWDGNQVWLITAGAGMFAAWPAVYAAAFSGFYLAMLLVLFALFMRPVGFDYRSKLEDPQWRNAWDWALFAGGAIPPLLFGVAFGNLLQGVPFHLDSFLKPHYGQTFIWALLSLLNPFAILAGLLSVAMLALHGAIWLQLRADKIIADRARDVITLLAPAVTVMFAIGGIWAYYGIDGYRIVSAPPPGAMPNPLLKEVAIVPGALFDIYRAYPSAILAPILGLAMPIAAWWCSQKERPGLGFLATSLTMAGIIATAGLSMFPFIMPSSSNPNSSLTVWDASSSHMTLTIMFWMVVVFLPIVLAYTVWAYVNMWGKVTTKSIDDNTHQVY